MGQRTPSSKRVSGFPSRGAGPLLGAHLSIAEGYPAAVYRAQSLGCETLQLFTKSTVQWQAKPISEEEAREFVDALRQTQVSCPTAHASYLINPASPDQEVWEKSTRALVDEVERCSILGIRNLVLHPGSHQGAGEKVGLRQVVKCLNRVCRLTRGTAVRMLVETTAGQGTALGYCFEHLAAILESVREPERVALCLDTCHLFAAGYPLAPAAAYGETFDALDRIVGLARVHVIHLNDSTKPCGSRVDRHAHIGEGYLGLEAFRLLLNDPRWSGVPMYLETPKGTRDGEEMDKINLARLRSLLGKRSKAATPSMGESS
jgi:deoxyribonuclease-4